MTFEEIQTECINARFKETQRPSVKRWVNLAYAKIWHSDEWTFRWAETTVLAPAGIAALTEPVDMHRVFSISDDTNGKLSYLTPDDFQQQFFGETSTGTPGYFTVLNRQVTLGPIPDQDITYDLIYEKTFTELVNDADVPGLPTEFHYVLVHGAMVIGLINENDFTFELPQRLYDEGLFSLRNGYVAEHPGKIQFKRDQLSNI